MASMKLVEDLRWASPLEIKKSLETAFTETFGSKEEYNKAAAAASKASKAQAKTSGGGKAAAPGNANGATGSAQASTSSAPVSNMFEEGFLASLHPVGGNPQIHEALREEHLKATGGLVHTRFPPEPNGALNLNDTLTTCCES
jgi:glutaminyl-tRNA synthetase